MIDFTKLNTIAIINEYKKLKIFPKNNSINTLKNINNNISTTGGNIVSEIKKLGLVDGIITEQNKIDYLNICLNYSMQSLTKGLMYFSFAESVGNDLNGCLNLKFLNLYYGHLFLSYSMLQFNGITFKFEKINNNNKKVLVNYIDIANNELISIDTSQTSRTNEINHRAFWEIFYNIIESSKLAPDNFMLDKIPDCNLNYFKSNNFLKSVDESECRNFYTYKYNSFYKINKNGRNIEIKDFLKDSSKSHNTDYVKILNTLYYEIVYLLGVFDYLSYKIDMKNELLPFLSTGGLKKYKKKITNNVEEFKFEIRSIV